MTTTTAERWANERRLLNIPDTGDTRSAFVSGARYALDALIEHLSGDAETETAALRLSDELLAFGIEAIAMLSPVTR